jgi:hypothetical protein
VIVGADFAGGDLLERARRFNVALIDTETLIQLLKIHSRTPLALTDMKELFTSGGLLRLNEHPEFDVRKRNYENQLELIPEILKELEELQASGESTTVRDLRWALARKFTENEISVALDLLLRLDIVQKTENERYIAVMIPRTAAAKLRVLADAITWT